MQVNRLYFWGLVVVWACSAHAQNDLFVATNGVDAGNCQDPGNPCATMKYAWLQALTINDVIHIAPGVYTEDNIVSPFLNSRNPFRGESPSNTIIQAHPLPGMATSRIFEVTTSGSGIKLQNLTLRHGVAPIDPFGNSGGNGGALRSVGVSEVSNCVFIANQSGDGEDAGGNAGHGGDGGAIYNFGEMTIYDSVIISNTTGQGGSSISNNFAGGGGEGGGIYNARTLTVYRTSIEYNTCGNGGLSQTGTVQGTGGSGGGLMSLTKLTMDQCTIRGNQAGPGANGGGVTTFFSAAAPNVESRITRSLICDNRAGDGVDFFDGKDGRSAGEGGGIRVDVGGISNSSFLVIQNTTISGNITLDGGEGSVIDGTGGNGGNGGGLSFRPRSYSQVHLEHCTLVSNQTGSAGNGSTPGTRGVGPGIHLDQTAVFTNSGVFISNTILANNATDGGVFIECEGGDTLKSEGYNLVRGSGLSFCGFDGNTNGNKLLTDPILLARQDLGGPTEVHPVLGVSPALDQGDPGFSSPPQTDQRGVLRELNGRIDIGAYEAFAPGDDSDGDGMPTQYELDHDLDPANDDRNQDRDGDGSNNFAEYSADSNPNDASNIWPGITDINMNSPPNILFPSTNSRVYTLQFADDLLASNAWISILSSADTSGNNSVLEITDNTSTQSNQNHRSYRIIPGPSDHASTIATMSNLSISPGFLVPIFDRYHFLYTGGGNFNGITSITISGTKDDPASVVTGLGSHPLAIGPNTFMVEVTAEDPAYKVIYTINIFRLL